MRQDEKHFTGAVVDGANLAGMIRDFGGSQTNFRGLFSVMSRIGKRDLPLLSGPTITIPPTLYGPGNRMYEELRRVGFQAVPVESRDSRDDAAVIKSIKDFCADQRIYRVLLVSCDHWLIRELLMAIRCRLLDGSPIRAYVLGTCCCNSDGHTRIKEELHTSLMRSSVVHFVDLFEYRTHIMRT